MAFNREGHPTTNGGQEADPASQTPKERLTVLCILLLAGGLLLVSIFLAVIFLQMTLTIFQAVCTTVLFTILLIFRNPALGIAFAFGLIVFVILIARWAGA